MRPRFALVNAAIRRAHSFADLAPAAVAVAKVTSKDCVDFDWGPLLAAGFPESTDFGLSEDQRAFLRALVENDDLWDRQDGNSAKWLNAAGLPRDRRAGAVLADGGCRRDDRAALNH
jgi:hypothetical protein